MNLSEKFSSEFSKNARVRGDDYRREGRVVITAASDSSIAARARGSEPYLLDISWQDATLLVRCDCPYFQDNGIPCKHLWATLLVAEEQGLLPDPASIKTLIADLDDLNLDLDLFGDKTKPKSPAVKTKAPAYKTQTPARLAAPAPPPQPAWKDQIASILPKPTAYDPSALSWSSSREILYVIEIAPSKRSAGPVVTLLTRERKKNGDWSVPKPLSLKSGQVADLPNAQDREILAILGGGQLYYGYGYSDYNPLPASSMLRPDLASVLIPLIARTGRAFMRMETQTPSEQWLPLSWDDAGPWAFELRVVPDSQEGQWRLDGILLRGDEQLTVDAPSLLVLSLVFASGGVAPLSAARSSWNWIATLRGGRPIRIPRDHGAEFLDQVLTRGDLPPISLPPELAYEEVSGHPRPCLRISRKETFGRQERLQADLSFEYQGAIFAEDDPRRGAFEITTRRFFVRNPPAERESVELLDQLGVKPKRPDSWDPTPHRELNPKRLPAVVNELVQAGWLVSADGVVFRRPGTFRIEVSSGVDWFELHGNVEYEGITAPLPHLLAALRRGEDMIRLGDGTFGMLPEEWLRRIGPLAGMGEATDGHIRFRHAQAGLLDALLAAQPEARCDETFALVRQHWRDFQGVAPAEQPAGFVGRLRDYQAEGLGWMHFLRQFGFGGCLADDMGVGKTAQVLALLENRRESRPAGEPHHPSLVVVPRSLIFNWKEETARFTPRLKVLDYAHPARGKEAFADYDLVLTTYGTLRRDIAHLQDIEFDYVVLDEAQAVKNAETVSSKAVRLLRGRHRLALSGTPVENHLGELWTIFEFLNPGMLGSSGAFRGADGSMRNPDEETRRMLGHALRPFILRRTKEQVARELPPKTEQTVYCELNLSQRKLYDELRQHYRDSLLASRREWEKSKLQVLEALLRLRQAACHPGLLDPDRAHEPAAKLEALWEQLREVREGGHKALVFSQFTSLLKIVRDRLDRERIAYQYLDGATRDRKTKVDRFQTDPACTLFLISLKAGGLGLNLTAAEYVFILDPWWNPAAEAQAVDRAHRIGQLRPVFAYRLIARDTVEEKILELQKSKRDLADAIVGAQNSLIRDLKPEDLALLLS
jgi:superfamily II DNA or RNA helicase